MNDKIKRIYFNPIQASKELGISTAEVRRRIKYLNIHVSYKDSFKIHYKQLQKIMEYKATLEEEIRVLKLDLGLVKRQFAKYKQEKNA